MLYNFNEEDHKKRMIKYVPALLEDLKVFNIKQLEDNGENVVFCDDINTITISYHVFYRYSGIAKLTKSYGKNEFEWTDVTDEMFMSSYMGSLIKNIFKNLNNNDDEEEK
jgi:hypothetical protein